MRLSLESLEQRLLLAGDAWSFSTLEGNVDLPSSAPITWFENYGDIPRIELDSLSRVNPDPNDGFIGPRLATGEWIVQLSEEAIQSLSDADDLRSVLSHDQFYPRFELISGLGSPGLILVHARGMSQASIESSLASNTDVASFSLNQIIHGQDILPNDTDFELGRMSSLQQVGLPNAWEESIGSLDTVVGVLDTGIDLDHRDLYLNIWFNQGEIPARFFDDQGSLLLDDIDQDGLITFYDLNHATRSDSAPFDLTIAGHLDGPNSQFVNDLNGNGYIDGLDILADPLWADGRDTDGNGEVDDFFGINYRGDAVRNNPNDAQGHGTHVAGTIGAIGGNDTGVTGVNWQTSLMSLRILDNSNQGDIGAAIRAVNYSRMMRERYRVDDDGRVVEGANVRVLNNSWGQPGGFETALERAIIESGDAGIMFVAAAGNGNLLGQSVDNDRTPFYPASYEADNVIAVAASDSDDGLALFSNFGDQSVDLAAPGIGIRSTEAGGGYGTRNGTSMATPHVAGVAGLIWSAMPGATVSEVKSAINTGAVESGPLNDVVKTGGRLNASAAVVAEVFAPSARLVTAQNITTAGGTTSEFTVEYFHRSGFDESAIEQANLLMTRQWGYGDQLTPRLKQGSVSISEATARATYVVDAPGGSWDKLDFGEYHIETIAGSLSARDGTQISQRAIGAFNVTISPQSDPSVLYVNTFDDRIDENSLRDAIMTANLRGGDSTVILHPGTYRLEIPPVIDPSSTFPPVIDVGGSVPMETTGSNAATGDLLIQSNITIVGSRNLDTIIDAQELDRVFRVSPGTKLTLRNLTLQNGVSAGLGGSILAFGDVEMDLVIMRDSQSVVGGGIASLEGHAQIERTRVTNNTSQFASIYVAGDASAEVIRSTIDNNEGGGLQSISSGDVTIDTSTFSGNRGGVGAIANGFAGSPGFASLGSTSLSADGRYVTFDSNASNLVPGDNNFQLDIFVYDRHEGRIERVSVNDAGQGGNNQSFSPSISADGRFVTFVSEASNLVSGDNDIWFDIFVFDRHERRIERVSVSDAGEGGNGDSESPSLSSDGRFVTFSSTASNLVAGDNNGTQDIFVYDRQEKRTTRVSVNDEGEEANGRSSSPSLSSDGRYVTFESDGSNLVTEDDNEASDIFVYDRQEDMIVRVSVDSAGAEGDGASGSPSLSADGRFVAFDSKASNLVLGDDNDASDIFVYDRNDGRIERVSVNDAEAEAEHTVFGSISPAISNDSRFVTFSSAASNLVPGDDNRTSAFDPFSGVDIFVYDRQEERIERVSVNDANAGGNRSSLSPSLSGDGRFVTFESEASNLVSGDNNDTFDVFVYDLHEQQIERAAIDFSGSVTIESSSFVDNEATLTLFGMVDVSSSLFVGNVNNAEADFNVHDHAFNLRLDDIQRSLVGALESESHLAPTHPLLLGNPAINQGDPALAGTKDQNDALRGDTTDVGAVDVFNGSVVGVTFADLNGNAKKDVAEPSVKIGDLDISRESGFENQVLSVSGLGEFQAQQLEPGNYLLQTQSSTSWTQTQFPIELIRGELAANDRDSFSPSLSGDGRIVAFASEATNLVPGDENGWSDIFVYDRQEQHIERVSINGDGGEGNGPSGAPSLSADGRFVTFESRASNLVEGDNNFRSHIFVYDRHKKQIERVSVNEAVMEGDSDSFSPSLSSDGRYVTFASSASNLVSGDNNEMPDDPYSGTDIFVYDRHEKQIKRVSVNDDGEEANGPSSSPSLSGDGRFVTFASRARNLVPGDNNEMPNDPDSSGQDIFVYDRHLAQIERVSVNDAGGEADRNSESPSLSADGRYVTFASRAGNLVAVDNNAIPNNSFSGKDIFVYDRQEGRIERVSVDTEGNEANGESFSPSLSADGRFVTFRSNANNLISEDGNNTIDFIYDRQERRIAMVSANDIAIDSDATFMGSLSPTLSADGRFITFGSSASHLVPGDRNELNDVFVVPNPFLPASTAVTLRAGETVQVEIPLEPDPGIIGGQLFFDTAVLNSVFDLGEEVLANYQVFLDTNGNGILNPGEPQTVSDAAGRYRFEDVPAFRNQNIVIAAPDGFEQVVPDRENEPGFTVFLPAGGHLDGIDFGFRPITTTGQSSDSTIRGRVMIDSNRNGMMDDGDSPAANRVVYMDAGTLGVRDFDDPQAVTNSDGFFEFTGLASTITPLRVVLDETFEQITPVGTSFALQKFPLQEIEKREGNPHAVATAFFDQDTFLDAAVLLAETNTLSIRLNDGSGGFGSRKIDLNLSELARESGRFTQPTSMVTGDFDGQSGLDVAITGNFSGNVLVLRNFDATLGQFASSQLIAVGSEPVDLVAGQFEGDSAIDLVVVNRFGSKLRVLRNDGGGTFSAGAAIATGGSNPVSIVTADFTRDGKLDIAVTHSITSLTDRTAGRVTVLVGDGNGGLTLSSTNLALQAGAIDSAVGDFNADGRPDLTVANFNSNSISVILGQADGSLKVQTTVLGTTQGAFDIAVADIDNDGDVDILASKLQQREVAIFRNIGIDANSGEVLFEPQESIGLGQFSFAERMPFALANLDGDTSGPSGMGTIDIIAVPQNTDTLYVLNNSLVQGARRAAVSGASADIASNIDFLIRPAILAPSFDLVSSSLTILEDAPPQSVSIDAVTKGRDGGPDLQFTVTSDAPSLIPSPGLIAFEGGTSASFSFTPSENSSGTAELTVRAVDAGADGLFGNADDGVFARSLTITVLAVPDAPVLTQLASDPNDADQLRVLVEVFDPIVEFVLSDVTVRGGVPSGFESSDFELGQFVVNVTPEGVNSVDVFLEAGVVQDSEGNGNLASNRLTLDYRPRSIVLSGAGEVVQMQMMDVSLLTTVEVIDIRGSGDNQLVLSSERIEALSPDRQLQVVADPGDTVEFDAGWSFDGVETIEEQFRRRFRNRTATVTLVGPNSWHNPLRSQDVDGNQSVTAIDALVVINTLAGGLFNDSTNTLVNANTVDPDRFLFLDVSDDGLLTAVDALIVINELSREGEMGEAAGAGEFLSRALPSPSLSIAALSDAALGNVGVTELDHRDRHTGLLVPPALSAPRNKISSNRGKARESIDSNRIHLPDDESNQFGEAELDDALKSVESWIAVSLD